MALLDDLIRMSDSITPIRQTFFGSPSACNEFRKIESGVNADSLFRVTSTLCEVPDLMVQVLVPKRQDRRLNKRVQSRRRKREKRAGTKPDDSIYLFDMSKIKEYMGGRITTEILAPYCAIANIKESN